MFRNKPGHIAGNKCKQEPDANYSFVPYMKERANQHFVLKSSYVYTCFEYLKGAKRRTARLGVVNSILTTHIDRHDHFNPYSQFLGQDGKFICNVHFLSNNFNGFDRWHTPKPCRPRALKQRPLRSIIHSILSIC